MRQLLERKSSGARGVSGSLREMSLPDVIQILSNGRKGGRLTVRSKGKSGEVHFRDVLDALIAAELRLQSSRRILPPKFVLEKVLEKARGTSKEAFLQLKDAVAAAHEASQGITEELIL